jgi:hypothetical protein
LSITNPEVEDKTTYFPLLENLKQQFVDITKYVNTQTGVEVISYDIVLRMRSQQMSTCGAALPASLKTDTRCGSYSLFLASTVYSTVARKRYTTDLSNLIFWILTASLTIIALFWGLLSAYRSAKTLEVKLNRTHVE